MGTMPGCARREGAIPRLTPTSPPNKHSGRAREGFLLLPSVISSPHEWFCSKSFPEPEGHVLEHLCWHMLCHHMSLSRASGKRLVFWVFFQIKGVCTVFYSFSQAVCAGLAECLIRNDCVSLNCHSATGNTGSMQNMRQNMRACECDT